MTQSIREFNGKLVLFEGNTPIRALTEQETKMARYHATPQYKSKHLNNIELIDYYIHSLMRGNADNAAIYKAEILNRMNHK